MLSMTAEEGGSVLRTPRASIPAAVALAARLGFLEALFGVFIINIDRGNLTCGDNLFNPIKDR